MWSFTNKQTKKEKKKKSLWNRHEYTTANPTADKLWKAMTNESVCVCVCFYKV